MDGIRFQGQEVVHHKAVHLEITTKSFSLWAHKSWGLVFKLTHINKKWLRVYISPFRFSVTLTISFSEP